MKVLIKTLYLVDHHLNEEMERQWTPRVAITEATTHTTIAPNATQIFYLNCLYMKRAIFFFYIYI